MKKHLFLVTALSLALFASSCGDANQKTSVIPQIDVNAEYPEKEIIVNVIYRQGQWWIVADDALLDAVSGGIAG